MKKMIVLIGFLSLGVMSLAHEHANHSERSVMPFLDDDNDEMTEQEAEFFVTLTPAQQSVFQQWVARRLSVAFTWYMKYKRSIRSLACTFRNKKPHNHMA